MATVFRKTYTQHLPQGTKIVQRQGKTMALWLDAKGRPHYDDLTVGQEGQHKIIRYSPTWTAKYRDANGNIVFEGTGCRDEQAARHVLAKMVQRVEHIKAGIITPQQYRMADHAEKPLAQHVVDYLEHLKAKTVHGRRVSKKHRDNVKRELDCIIAECGFRRLGDITRDAMERWMNLHEEAGMGARTRNTYRSSIVAFCNWCLETDRLPAAAARLLRVPRDFVRILDRDLATARIPKIDERGRRVDIHALRHTFGTHLSLAGVAPRVAQAAMRHSTLELTMNIYTDPQLLDVAGAINALPAFATHLPQPTAVAVR